MTPALLIALALGQFIGPLGGVDATPFRKRVAFSFSAPAAGDYATLTATTGQTITCARASTTTVLTGAGATPTVVASGHCAVDYRGLQVEGAATNVLLNSGAPATQTTASLSTGPFAGWMDGTGSVAFAVGSATATGLPCTASSGVTCLFTVTVAGTVVATVTGSPTREQLENSSGRTSYIPTAGTTVARAEAMASISPVPAFSGSTVSANASTTLEVATASFANFLVDYTSNSSNAWVLGTETTPKVRFNAFVGGSSNVLLSGSPISLNASHKVAMSYDGATQKTCLDGACASSALVVSMPSGSTGFAIGSDTAAGAPLGGFLASICFSLSATGCAP